MQNKKEKKKEEESQTNRKKVRAKIYKQSYMHTFTTTKATRTKSKNKTNLVSAREICLKIRQGYGFSPQLACVTHHTLLWEALLSTLLVEANRFT